MSVVFSRSVSQIAVTSLHMRGRDEQGREREEKWREGYEKKTENERRKRKR